jgi:hypothetical protein
MEQLGRFATTVKLLGQEAIESKVATKSGAALRATGTALYLWGEVLLVVGGPPARRWWRWQRALSLQEVRQEAGVLAACLALFALRRWLQRKQFGARAKRAVRSWRRAVGARYKALQVYVAHQSRLAALCLPHACYLGACYLALRAFPSLGAFLCEDNMVGGTYTLNSQARYTLHPALLIYFIRRFSLLFYLLAHCCWRVDRLRRWPSWCAWS